MRSAFRGSFAIKRSHVGEGFLPTLRRQPSSSKVKPMPSRSSLGMPFPRSQQAAPGASRSPSTKIGRDAPHLPPVEHWRARRALARHGRRDTTTAASPGHFSRRVAAQIAPPRRMIGRQPGSARVALADRVGGDQPEGTALAQQTEGAAEEMRDEVGVAVRALVQRLQPVRIVRPRLPAMIVFLPAKGGLPTIASKPPILAREHLRELDLPVERADRMLARRRLPQPRSSSSHRRCRAGEPALDLVRGASPAPSACRPRRRRR